MKKPGCRRGEGAPYKKKRSFRRRRRQARRPRPEQAKKIRAGAERGRAESLARKKETGHPLNRGFGEFPSRPREARKGKTRGVLVDYGLGG